MRRICVLVVQAILCSTLTGCGSDNLPATFAVTGAVEFEGRPVEGASVTLVPHDANGRSASGTTDVEGKFQVSTYLTSNQQPQGALPGEYVVIVSKEAVHQLPAGLTPHEEQEAFDKLGPPKNLLPKKYASPTTSPYKVEIIDSAPEPLILNLES